MKPSHSPFFEFVCSSMNGTQVVRKTINLKQIAQAHAAGNNKGTMLLLINGTSLQVTLPYEDVLALLGAEKQDATEGDKPKPTGQPAMVLRNQAPFENNAPRSTNVNDTQVLPPSDLKQIKPVAEQPNPLTSSLPLNPQDNQPGLVASTVDTAKPVVDHTPPEKIESTKQGKHR